MNSLNRVAHIEGLTVQTGKPTTKNSLKRLHLGGDRPSPMHRMNAGTRGLALTTPKLQRSHLSPHARSQKTLAKMKIHHRHHHRCHMGKPPWHGGEACK